MTTYNDYTKAISQWSSANEGNKTVQASANDLFYNWMSSQLGTQSAVSYANQMTPIAQRYQAASTKIAEESDLRRLAAETSALRGLTQQQGDLQYRNNQLTASTTRYTADQQLRETGLLAGAQRYSADQQFRSTGLLAGAQRFESGEATRRTGMETAAQRYGYDQAYRGVELQTGAQRYESDRATDRTRIQSDTQRHGYDQDLAGRKYTADRGVDVAGIQAGAQMYDSDRGLEGVKYGADRGLEGIRDTNRSGEERIRIAGGEDRKTLVQGTDETLRLRADARGAIRTAGRSFYG